MIRLLSLLFGCAHSRTTWPQGKGTDIHVACLDCGRRLRYSWSEMRVVRGKGQSPDTAGPLAELAR
jgi:RNase P subunit RPR2